MSSVATEACVAALAFSRQNLMGFLDDIPADKLCFQPAPGLNHALWIAGHLACTDDFFLQNMADQPRTTPEEWNDLFGMGSTPLPDADKYPSLDEIKEKLTEGRECIIDWYRGLSEEQLAEPLPEEWRDFAPNVAAMAASIAWHEGLHTGQLTSVRRALGIAPKVG